MIGDEKSLVPSTYFLFLSRTSIIASLNKALERGLDHQSYYNMAKRA